MKSVASLIASYVVIAFLTGGYYWNHRTGPCSGYPGVCGTDAVAVALLWPIYWGARGAIWVTK